MRNLFAFQALTVVLILLTTNHKVNSGRVLVVSTAPSYSHHVVFQSVSLALNKRGHDVVFVTTTPLKNVKLTNYTEIDFTVAYEVLQQLQTKNYIPMFTSLRKSEVENIVHNLAIEITKRMYTHPEIQKLFAVNSTEKFDVVIVETTMGEGVYALGHLLNVPMIGLLSLGPHTLHHYAVGNPLLPSHASNWEYFYNTGDNVSFWDRIRNTFQMWHTLYQWKTKFFPAFDKTLKTLVGRDLPPLDVMVRNMSLFLCNYHPILADARPWQSNVVFFNGFHLKENPPPLKKEIREFLGNATNGFVYMSLGSNMRSSQLSPDTIQAIYNVFSRLPCRVLWKFETNALTIKHDNILISKWIPQQSVLAHPNIKLFIYQGGYQSTEEAVHNGVPVIGIPIMFDQFYTTKKMEELGAGRRLDLPEINEETFQETVLDVLNNKRYKEGAMKVRRLMKDNPYNTKDYALWWVEYVIRNKGAPHLRFTGLNQPLYKRFDADIIAFLSIVSFIIIVISAILLILILRWWYKHYRKVSSSKLFKRKDE